MKPNNPAVARTRHVWRAARQQSGVSCAIPLAASGIGVRPAPPTAHTIPAKAQLLQYTSICPHFAHVLAQQQTGHRLRQRVQVIIDRYYPSTQICSQCGHRDGRKPLDIREWECPQCGIRLDRDWNAAVNILDAAGLAESLNARGGDVRRRLAQAGRNADAREAGTRRTARLH